MSASAPVARQAWLWLVCATFLCHCISTQITAVAASGGVETQCSFLEDRVASGSGVTLELKVKDSVGDAVPAEDFLVRNGSRLNVYAVHEGFGFWISARKEQEEQAAVTSTGSLRVGLAFPASGTWSLYMEYYLTTGTQQQPLRVEHSESVLVHEPDGAASVGASQSGLQSSSPAPESSAISPSTVVAWPGITRQASEQMQGADTPSVDFNAPDGPPLITATLVVDHGSRVYAHQCVQFVTAFSSRNGANLTAAQMSEQAALQMLVVPVNPQSPVAAEITVLRGFDASTDEQVFRDSEVSPCSIVVQQEGNTYGARVHVAEHRMVTYHTFTSPGVYVIFTQVQRSGALHVSRHTVYVGGLSAQVHHIPAGANSPARLSISVDAYSTADDEGTRIPINNWKPLHGKTMNIIAIHSDLDLFFDLSTEDFASSEIDTESSRPELELPIYFAQGGTYTIRLDWLTAADVLGAASDVVGWHQQSVNIPGDSQETSSPLPAPALQVAVYPFGADTIKAGPDEPTWPGKSLSALEDHAQDPRSGVVTAQLTLNGGERVYAGDCTQLRLNYLEAGTGGKLSQINNLQVLDGAAAKVVVLALEGSNRETQVLLAWPSASTPAAAAKDQQALPPGVTISAQTDMCLGPASLAPRNSSDTAQSAAGSVRFTHPGLYAVISQAQRGSELIWTRHIIRVCSGASGLAWSDACVWDTAPASGADVIIPSGAHVVLDQQPPPMKTLQVDGTLEVAAGLDVRLEVGTILIPLGGRFVAGTEAEPYTGALTLVLDSTLLEACPGYRAPATLDVQGQLQLIAAKAAGAEVAPRGWLLSAAEGDRLDPDESGLEESDLQIGDVLGVASPAGGELSVAAGFPQDGTIVLVDPLQLTHSFPVAFHRLTRSIVIEGMEGARVLVRAGNSSTDSDAPPARKLLSTAGPLLRGAHTQLGSGQRSEHWPAARRRLLESVMLTEPAQSGLSTAQTRIRSAGYRSRSGKGSVPAAPGVSLFGVEMRGLGDSSSPDPAAFTFVDDECSQRQAATPQNISIRGSTFHSNDGPCVSFTGCAASLQLEDIICFSPVGNGITLLPFDPSSTGQTPEKWAIKIEDVAVVFPLQLPTTDVGTELPAGLRVDLPAQVQGSTAAGLTLSVSGGQVDALHGPAVLWSPELSGSLMDIQVSSLASLVQAYYSACTSLAGGAQTSPFDSTALHTLPGYSALNVTDDALTTSNSGANQIIAAAPLDAVCKPGRSGPTVRITGDTTADAAKEDAACLACAGEAPTLQAGKNTIPRRSSSASRALPATVGTYRIWLSQGTSSFKVSTRIREGVQQMMLGYTAWAQFVSAEQDLQVDTSTFELLATDGHMELTEQDLGDRWGTWHLTVVFEEATEGDVMINVEFGEAKCPGDASCQGHGSCVRTPTGAAFCRCQTGWFGRTCESDDMDAARTIRRQDVLALDQFLQQQRAGHAVTVTPTSASSAATPGDFCSSVLATLAEVPREFDEVSKGTVTSASPAAGTQKTALEPVAAPPDLSIWSETLLVMPDLPLNPKVAESLKRQVHDALDVDESAITVNQTQATLLDLAVMIDQDRAEWDDDARQALQELMVKALNLNELQSIHILALKSPAPEGGLQARRRLLQSAGRQSLASASRMPAGRGLLAPQDGLHTITAATLLIGLTEAEVAQLAFEALTPGDAVQQVSADADSSGAAALGVRGVEPMNMQAASAVRVRVAADALDGVDAEHAATWSPEQWRLAVVQACENAGISEPPSAWVLQRSPDGVYATPVKAEVTQERQLEVKNTSRKVLLVALGSLLAAICVVLSIIVVWRRNSVTQNDIEWELFEKGGSFLGHDMLNDDSKDGWEDGTRIRVPRSKGGATGGSTPWTAGWSDDGSDHSKFAGLSAHTYPDQSHCGVSLSSAESTDRRSGQRESSDEEPLTHNEAAWAARFPQKTRLPKSDRRVTDEGARTVKKTWSFLGRTVPAEVGTERATIAGTSPLVASQKAKQDAKDAKDAAGKYATPRASEGFMGWAWPGSSTGAQEPQSVEPTVTKTWMKGPRRSEAAADHWAEWLLGPKDAVVETATGGSGGGGADDGLTAITEEGPESSLRQPLGSPRRLLAQDSNSYVDTFLGSSMPDVELLQAGSSVVAQASPQSSPGAGDVSSSGSMQPVSHTFANPLRIATPPPATCAVEMNTRGASTTYETVIASGRASAGAAPDVLPVSTSPHAPPP